MTPLRKRWKDGEIVRYCYPFQACDFVAWEHAKAMNTYLQRRGDSFMARKSLARIAPITPDETSAQDATWRWCDAEAIAEMCKLLKVLYRVEPRYEVRFFKRKR